MEQKAFCTLIFLILGGIFVDATNPKDVMKWVEKIKEHKFLTSCWGPQTMIEYYKISKQYCEECMQLTPAFDISLFEEDHDNMLDNDPFIMSQQGFQTLPSQIFNAPAVPVNRLGSAQRPQNPWEAWMSLWAPIYGQPLPSAYKFSRSKRAIDPPSKADLENFAQQVGMHKNMKKGMIGNLTCVLSKFGVMNDNLQINLPYYINDMWKDFPRGEEPKPEFKQKVIKGYQNCYQLSESIPMDLLVKKGPFYQQFGRQMMFFKCAKKMECTACVKKELAEWVEFLYGTPNAELRARLGLPNDKLDAAFMAMTIKDEMKDPTMKFVEDFLFSYEH